MKCLTYSEGRCEDCTKWYIIWAIVVRASASSGIVSGSLCQASNNAGGDIQRAPLNQKSREFFTLPEHDSCRQHVRVVKRTGEVGGGRFMFTCRAQERAANGQSMGTQQLPTRLNSTRRAHWVD